jgi:hypothetical protein
VAGEARAGRCQRAEEAAAAGGVSAACSAVAGAAAAAAARACAARQQQGVLACATCCLCQRCAWPRCLLLLLSPGSPPWPDAGLARAYLGK